MFSGDSLSVLLFFAGTALAGLMGAIVAPPGWRTLTLWIMTGVFTILSIIWVAAPSASPLVQSAPPIISALAQSGALVIVVTVGAVALMLGGRSSRMNGTEESQPVADPDRDVANQRALMMAISALSDARDSARVVLRQKRPREVEREAHRMRSSLLTGQKEFGLPSLPKLSDETAQLEASIFYIEAVLPYLEQRHIETARAEAQKLIDKFSSIAPLTPPEPAA